MVDIFPDRLYWHFDFHIEKEGYNFKHRDIEFIYYFCFLAVCADGESRCFLSRDITGFCSHDQDAVFS